MIWLECMRVLNGCSVCGFCLSSAHRKSGGKLRQKKENLTVDSDTEICTITHTPENYFFWACQTSRSTEPTNKGRTLRRWAKRKVKEKNTWRQMKGRQRRNRDMTNLKSATTTVCFQKLVVFETSHGYARFTQLLSTSVSYFSAGLRRQLVDASWFTVPQTCNLKIRIPLQPFSQWW